MNSNWKPYPRIKPPRAGVFYLVTKHDAIGTDTSGSCYSVGEVVRALYDAEKGFARNVVAWDFVPEPYASPAEERMQQILDEELNGISFRVGFYPGIKKAIFAAMRRYAREFN